MLETFCVLLVFPTLYFCFRSLTSNSSLKWYECLWFLPVFFILPGKGLLYFFMDENQIGQYIKEFIQEKQSEVVTFSTPLFYYQNLIDSIYHTIAFSQVIFILIYATVCLLRHRNQLDEFFGIKSIENNSVLLIGIYFMLILSLFTNRMRFYSGNSFYLVEVLMFLWALLIYLISYHIYQLKYTVEDFPRKTAPANKENVEYSYVFQEISGVTKECDVERAHDKYSLLFEELIEKEQIFLQSNLRLNDVANMMNTNRTYVSRWLNEEFHCSFYDYMNRKRIEYAISLMQSTHNLTQEQIAEQCGFSHASSFSRTFKQHVGITFREWQKENLSF
jgi:AraC-like DNA-binding protein